MQRKNDIMYGFSTHHGSLAYSSILFFSRSLWRKAYLPSDVTTKREVLKAHFMYF